MASAQFGDSIRIDLDTNDFTNEIERTPRFRDTLKWWSGPWIEKVPYYRPLTISLFWAQYQAFGPDGRVGFTWVHRLSHIAFLLVLLGFFGLLLGKWRAAVGVSLFAAGWNGLLLLPTGTDAFNCWKDECDIWSALTTVGACWAIYVWSQKAPAQKWWTDKRWWLALGFYLLGITIKELGMLAPLFMALTLFFAHKLRERWLSLLPFFLISPLFWLFRLWILGGWGNRTGNGDAWPTRFLSQVVGLPSSIITGDFLSVAALGLAGVIVSLFWWRCRPSRKFLKHALALFSFVFVIGAVLTHRYQPESIEVQIMRFFVGNSLFDAGLIALLCVGFALMLWQLRQGDRTMTLAWLWVVFGFLPLVVQPPTSPHVHYPIAPGWSLWLSCLLFSTVSWLQTRLNLTAKTRFAAHFPPRNAEIERCL